MTKSRIIPVVLIIAIAGAIFFFRPKGPQNLPTQNVASKDQPKKEPFIDVEKLEIDGKRVVGLPPGKEKAEIMNLKVANHATDNWKPALEKALLAQGGDKIKDMKIEKLDSYVWTESGLALYVETVKVTLKGERNQSVSFNAMVDSETGKILKNWNQPVIDHFNSKDQMKIRIDPRYHNE